MPLMRITELGRRNLYLTRQMWADDQHAFIESACSEAAKALGYAEDPQAEPAPVPPQQQRAQRRRGRPRRAPAPLETKTVPELREMAEEKGVELPSRYVKKDELVDIVEDADTDQGDERKD